MLDIRMVDSVYVEILSFYKIIPLLLYKTIDLKLLVTDILGSGNSFSFTLMWTSTCLWLR